MFDENQPTAAGAPPANLPTEPADMFDGVKDVPPEAVGMASRPPDALSAGRLSPKSSAPSATPAVSAQAAYKIKEPVLGKAILGIVAILVLGALGYGGYWGYKNFFIENDLGKVDIPRFPVETTPAEEATVQTELPTDEVSAIQEAPTTTPTSTDLSEAPGAMANDEILFGEPVDTDKDGLDDIRERDLGTDANKMDSDDDGLNDGDEVLIFKTDPLNPDTDGDTYLDGGEVRAGYNPLGPGKLFNAPTSTAPTSAKK